MELETKGVDIDRIKNLEYTIEDTERWNEKLQEKKEGVDVGFTSYDQINYKKYLKTLKDFTPVGIDTLETSSNLNFDHEPTPQNIQKLSDKVDEQRQKRGSFSRRRKFDQEDNVDYINERNMRFNKKVSRAYDKFTTETKANFERGTAL
jgi:pre-mRNA-splicing factor SYF2